MRSLRLGNRLTFALVVAGALVLRCANDSSVKLTQHNEVEKKRIAVDLLGEGLTVKSTPPGLVLTSEGGNYLDVPPGTNVSLTFEFRRGYELKVFEIDEKGKPRKDGDRALKQLVLNDVQNDVAVALRVGPKEFVTFAPKIIGNGFYQKAGGGVEWNATYPDGTVKYDYCLPADASATFEESKCKSVSYPHGTKLAIKIRRDPYFTEQELTLEEDVRFLLDFSSVSDSQVPNPSIEELAASASKAN